MAACAFACLEAADATGGSDCPQPWAVQPDLGSGLSQVGKVQLIGATIT